MLRCGDLDDFRRVWFDSEEVKMMERQWRRCSCSPCSCFCRLRSGFCRLVVTLRRSVCHLRRRNWCARSSSWIERPIHSTRRRPINPTAIFVFIVILGLRALRVNFLIQIRSWCSGLRLLPSLRSWDVLLLRKKRNLQQVCFIYTLSHFWTSLPCGVHFIHGVHWL